MQEEKRQVIVVENDMVKMIDCNGLYNYEGDTGKFTPCNETVEDIKYTSRLGYFVILTSNHGYQFVRHLVSEFGLSDYVDLIMNKPKERL